MSGDPVALDPARAARLDPAASEPAVAGGESPFFNRELSWLEFNRRVLHEAEDDTVPLLERLKFVAIFGGNLDEFFMKRVGGLKLQVAAGRDQRSPDGMSASEQIAAIAVAVRPMMNRAREVLTGSILPALAGHGVELVRWRDLTEPDREWCRRYFASDVFPILTPLGLDTSHPFPFISNLSLSLAVALRAEGSGELRFARVKVPPSLPRWVRIPDTHRYLALEEMIAEHLGRLFPGEELLETYAFRVTRAADVERLEEPAEDLLESIQEELRERRFATVVRLEVVPEMPPWMRRLLGDELEVGEDDVYEVLPPLAARDLFPLAALPFPALRERPWRPVPPPRLRPGPDGREPDLFREIRRGDLLVHHPYDSFASSVQRFLQVAAEDPDVLAIKQTLYRTSRRSPVVQALIEAADRGKQVAVLVELRASFDEARNIEWAEALEGAGAHVAYGVVGFKTHAKVSLVVRQEPDGLRTYTHVATGNYNTDTAELYTDLGLFTCDPLLGADMAQLFNLLTSGHLAGERFERMLVAPVNMRSGILERIRREIEHRRAGRPGRIVAKMNSLEDPEIVRALYDASAAGVEIELIVRGLCRLRPGLPGRSETIRVLSIVGRFLEHARIFHFGNGAEPEYFIGSADWMSRNLDRRVEAMVPVATAEQRARLEEILELQLADNCKAWDLAADGTWTQRSPAPGEPRRDSQQQLMDRALAGAASG
ncbi:MAG TPA: polyphosphate kinase 1 [Thermoanaerobaculia bacterium]|nr:polyphosphate kinase 1 [Thermoanaerobaculia bacterium]